MLWFRYRNSSEGFLSLCCFLLLFWTIDWSRTSLLFSWLSTIDSSLSAWEPGFRLIWEDSKDSSLITSSSFKPVPGWFWNRRTLSGLWTFMLFLIFPLELGDSLAASLKESYFLKGTIEAYFLKTGLFAFGCFLSGLSLSNLSSLILVSESLSIKAASSVFAGLCRPGDSTD